MITATDGEQRSEEGTGKRLAGGEQAMGVTRAGGGSSQKAGQSKDLQDRAEQSQGASRARAPGQAEARACEVVGPSGQGAHEEPPQGPGTAGTSLDVHLRNKISWKYQRTSW